MPITPSVMSQHRKSYSDPFVEILRHKDGVSATCEEYFSNAKSLTPDVRSGESNDFAALMEQMMKINPRVYDCIKLGSSLLDKLGLDQANSTDQHKTKSTKTTLSTNVTVETVVDVTHNIISLEDVPSPLADMDTEAHSEIDKKIKKGIDQLYRELPYIGTGPGSGAKRTTNPYLSCIEAYWSAVDLYGIDLETLDTVEDVLQALSKESKKPETRLNKFISQLSPAVQDAFDMTDKVSSELADHAYGLDVEGNGAFSYCIMEDLVQNEFNSLILPVMGDDSTERTRLDQFSFPGPKCPGESRGSHRISGAATSATSATSRTYINPNDPHGEYRDRIQRHFERQKEVHTAHLVRQAYTVLAVIRCMSGQDIMQAFGGAFIDPKQLGYINSLGLGHWSEEGDLARHAAWSRSCPPKRSVAEMMLRALLGRS